MAINIKWMWPLLAAILAGCGKNSASSPSCENNNRVFIYSNNYFSAMPDVDSFSLGQQLEVKLTLPKKFIDEAYNRFAEYKSNEVFAALTIIVLDSVRTGAVPYFDVSAPVGKLYRDSISYDTEYLRNRNFTAVAVLQPGDSLLRAHYILEPKQKGIYTFAFSFFGKKDIDCSLFRYYIRPGVTNQHLYFLAAANNGSLNDFERAFNYCFKVY